MTETATTASLVLHLHFDGPRKPIDQLRPRLIAKAFHKTLRVRAEAARDGQPSDAGVDVVVRAPDLDLLALREAWASGWLTTHQGVTATQLVVFRAPPTVPGRRADLEAAAERVVALSRG